MRKVVFTRGCLLFTSLLGLAVAIPGFENDNGGQGDPSSPSLTSPLFQDETSSSTTIAIDIESEIDEIHQDPPTSSFSTDRPNFVFIFTDDIGYGDLACTGHPYARTPNIDRLAREGVIMTQFHVNGNVCPHSRAGIMTGRNPSWFPNYTAQHGFMGRTTITNLLQNAGYRTGHVGKWNIGGDPEGDAIDYGIDFLSRPGHNRSDPRGREGDRFDEAINFIVSNKDEPFYLNLWAMALHTPVEAPQAIVDQFSDVKVKYGDFDEWQHERFDALKEHGGNLNRAMQLYLADLFALDLNVGRLLDALDENGLTDNTIVVFTSDNGPAVPGDGASEYNIGYAGGLRGGKHSFYEGGPLVPFLMRWPNGAPAGTINDSLLFGLDWLPTVCTLAECDIPWEIVEGEDMSDVFQGTVRDREQPLLYRWISPRAESFNRQWIRYGHWKFVRHDNELYDLREDFGERNNVVDRYPWIAQALTDYLVAWDATLPTAHAREDSPLLPFDPNEPVPQLGLPFIDLDDSMMKPEDVALRMTPKPFEAVAEAPQSSPVDFAFDDPSVDAAIDDSGSKTTQKSSANGSSPRSFSIATLCILWGLTLP